MRIRWTHAPAEDLEHIKEYLTDHHPQFARSTIIELYETIRSLKTAPRLGRPGREEGTRELVFTRRRTSWRTASSYTLHILV